MSAAAPILLAALGGAAVAIALAEWLAALPSLRRHVETASRALLLAGRENRAPTEGERRRLGFLAGVALALAAVLVSGSAPLAGVAAAGPAAAGWIVAHRRRRYRLAIEADIPIIAAAIADSVAAGGSLRIALPAAAAGLDGPSAVEMARVSADLELGIPPHRAFAALGCRVPSERIDALVAAVLSQQRAGGDLAGLLRRHGRAATQRARAEKEARSATAQARMTGGLVVAMPLVMAMLVELVAPGFIAGMLAEPAAVVLLALAGVLQVIGFLAIRKLGEVGR
ncbi:MAG TPA: type II secretion system F family protein [Solirubrobacterales bacterium]|nr:type II secretion system F family protein [Solirubrobacterales bacterium]